MDAATTVREPATHARRGAAAHAALPAWAAVAAWGAGLLELALGAGSMTSASGGAARGAGTVLVVLGAVGLGWGAATLARGRVIAPRAGVAGALTGLVAAVFVLSMDPAKTSVVAVAAASVLLIAVALGCGAAIRGGRASGQPRLAVLFVAVVIVAALVTPALGATEAGRLAPDHGGHGFVDPGHH